MEDLFLGYDLGSSSAKTVVRDKKGHTLASAVYKHETLSPFTGYSEQNPEDCWWKGFKESISYIRDREGIDLTRIKGICCTGFIPALCPVDKEGQALSSAMMHTDLRAMDELKEINKSLHSPISMGTLLPQLLWYKKNKPELYNKTWTVLNPHSYIAWKLTDRASCDFDSAFVAGGPEILTDSGGNLEWNEAKIAEIGINPALLPKPAEANSSLGYISSKAAHETGLSRETQVICGTGDSFAAMLGFGLTEPGEMMIYLGSSATQILLSSSIEKLMGGPHFSEGKASFTGRILSCGDTFHQFLKLFNLSDLAKLDKEAERIPPGAEGILWLPHLKQKQEKSSFLNRESLLGFTSDHTESHAYRAMLEGLAFNIRENFDPVKDKVNKLTVGGGGANSSIFVQIIADTLGIPVIRSSSNGSADGAAFLAAVGSGTIKKITQACREWAMGSQTIKPQEEQKRLYNSWHVYRQKIRKNTDESHTLLDAIYERK